MNICHVSVLGDGAHLRRIEERRRLLEEISACDKYNHYLEANSVQTFLSVKLQHLSSLG